MELTRLPDNLILEIFSYLPVKDRCIAGRVCRRWRRITNDNSLWRHVDLLPYKLDLKKTWKVIRSHLSECLRSIKLRGYMESKGPSWKTNTVSNAMLEDLRGRCPNISELHLHLIYIDKLDASKLPHSLTSLHLTRCSWQVGWLKNVDLPDLRDLVVDKTTAVENRDMADFIKFTNLETLSLRGCYRVKEAGINTLAENLINLRELDLCDTDCTDLNLHHVGRHMKLLVKLGIASCLKVTSAGVICIADGLASLQHLDISNCGVVDNSCFPSLLKSKSLRTLKHTQNTASLSEEELEKIKRLSE